MRLVDARTLVCCSLLARKIYLVHFDLEAGSFVVMDDADTMYAGATTQTDLCDVDGQGRVVTSNCEGGQMSLYQIDGDQVRHDRDLSTDLVGNFCHGARFFGPDVVAATALREPRGVHFYEIQTMRKLLHVKTDRLAKDACSLPGGRAAVVVTDGAPSSQASRSVGTSEILIADIDLDRGTSVIVGRRVYDVGQLDAIAHEDGRLYVSDSRGGRLLVVDARTLDQIGEVGGYDFPHGVDVKYGLLAVACYGTNAISVSARQV